MATFKGKSKKAIKEAGIEYEMDGQYLLGPLCCPSRIHLKGLAKDALQEK